MFGIDNITNNNGWGMAAVGASIVFLGLVVLSTVIAQIHKILEFWENRNRKKASRVMPPEDKAPALQEQRLPTVSELCSIYRPLVEQLQEPFQLIQLHEKTKK
ncbi:MAG: OadG family protein, partial [Desulfobacterales bacterium]